jgi:DNA-binding NarL/FixJ family response regulator
MNRVVVIDDNPLFHLGLRELMKTAQPDLTIFEAETFAGGRAHVREYSDVSLVMLDIKVPDYGGFVGLFPTAQRISPSPGHYSFHQWECRICQPRGGIWCRRICSEIRAL